MLKKVSVFLTVLSVLGTPIVASAGMSHNPHNAKYFMGFERREKVQHEKAPGSFEKIEKSPYQKRQSRPFGKRW